LYRNVHANNADLPTTAVVHEGGPLPADAAGLTGTPLAFDELFRTYRILIAPTQFSATAPLKMAARAHGFRAATMPGFAPSMIPALRLDYGVIGRRCDRFKKLLDDAVRCDLVFAVGDRRHELTLDLRHRTATASGGVFPSPGTAGNVPSGETYIVPYEGEHAGDPSGTRGELPVQLGDEVVLYRVEANRAVEVLSRGPTSEAEARRLAEEPAYGNLAELGLGVLADFGLQPTGELLLDEKLGLHIAFGRSEHFGGQVGPKQFSRPEKVVHIDRVYTDSIQPKVLIAAAVLTTSDGRKLDLMRDGRYVVALDG
jgi:leucyl aminopeptidase (aminopeptidase T)